MTTSHLSFYSYKQRNLFIFEHILMWYLDTYEEEIEYVLYVRKSTDESSWKQQQSIPDQINTCLWYAQREGLKIKEKSNKFPFETKDDIKKEDNCAEKLNKQTYQGTRHLYIIKEEHSAKEPYGRPKFNRLMQMVEKWEIKWIISYSPDRQARNMVDWWRIIHFAHEEKVDLKYANFSFENNAWGRMMLGVWFVFSKQYSDKLSEDVSRWYKSKVEQWKCFDKVFYWYRLKKNEMIIEKDDNNFELMQMAFKKKLTNPNKRTDKELANRLNKSWFRKRNRKWKLSKVSHKKLWEQWKRPLYFGIYIHWSSEVDLRIVNPHIFEPMISEEEHRTLIHRSIEWAYRYTKATKEENEVIFPLSSWFVKAEDSSSLSPELPNKNTRHKKNLLELQKTNPTATFADVVLPHQIKYSVKNPKTKKSKWISISFADIELAVSEMLNGIKIDEQAYEEYVIAMKAKIFEEDKERLSQVRIFEMQRTMMIEERDEYYRAHYWKKTTAEQEIYDKDMDDYSEKIDYLSHQLNELETKKRMKIEEYEIFMDMLSNISDTFKNSDYVRKGRLIKILYSNITIDKQKRLSLELKPWLESIFSLKISSTRWPGIRTRDLGLKRPLL